MSLNTSVIAVCEYSSKQISLFDKKSIQEMQHLKYVSAAGATPHGDVNINMSSFHCAAHELNGSPCTLLRRPLEVRKANSNYIFTSLAESTISSGIIKT